MTQSLLLLQLLAGTPCYFHMSWLSPCGTRARAVIGTYSITWAYDTVVKRVCMINNTRGCICFTLYMQALQALTYAVPMTYSTKCQTLTVPSSPALANIPCPLPSSRMHHCRPLTSLSPCARRTAPTGVIVNPAFSPSVMWVICQTINRPSAPPDARRPFPP